MAEQTCRVVAEQIDATVTVDIDQHRPFGVLDAERERVEVQHGARVAAGHHGRRSGGHGRRPGPAVRIRGVCRGEGSIEIDRWHAPKLVRPYTH